MVGGDLSLTEDFREGWRTVRMRLKKNPDDEDEKAQNYSFSISQSPVPHALTMRTVGTLDSLNEDRITGGISPKSC